MIYHAPKDHKGPLTVPEGCTTALVWNCPSVTDITFRAGCTTARVWNCPSFPGLHTCERGYVLVSVGGRYMAGGRSFSNAADAIAHWSSPDYPDPERGAGFVEAIKKHAGVIQ